MSGGDPKRFTIRDPELRAIVFIASLASAALISRLWDSERRNAHDVGLYVVEERVECAGWPIHLSETSRDVVYGQPDDLYIFGKPVDASRDPEAIAACAPFVLREFGSKRAAHVREGTPWRTRFLWWNWLLYPCALAIALVLPVRERGTA